MTADPQYSTLGSPFRSTGAFTEVEQEALLREESEVLDGTTLKILGKAPDRRGTQILRAGALTLIAGRTTLLALLASTASARAEQPPAPCPGNTTVEMRVCAAAAWERSNAQLQRRLTPEQLRQWQSTTRLVCARAYAPYRQGTIYPQLVVSCDDHLNLALLREFLPLTTPEHPSHAPQPPR